MRTPNGSHGILALDQPAQEHVDHSLNFVNIRNGLKGLSAGKLASSTLDTLKPEFLQRRKPAGRRPLSSTAWLDGLRGWAALGVCFVHLTVYTHPKIELCYGAEIEPGVYNKTPAALPFIRILFTGGHLAVMIFFIMSGYVLTRRMISLLHEGRREDFVSAVHSAICRRPLRLYLPVVWSTLALVFIWHVFGIATPWPDRQPTIFSELVTWCKDIMKFSFFYRNGFLFTYYNIHTWTIPVELRGSMFIFVWLFALHQFTNRLRILLTFAMTIYLAVGCAGAWYAAFFAGMLTAELDLLAAEDNAIQIKLPWNGFLKALKRRPKILATLLHAMLFCGLFLGSEPSGDYIEKEEILGSCPGWKTLSKMIPAAYNASYRGEWESTHRWFWLFWASWMLLVSIKGIRWVRSIFESRFSQCTSSFLPPLLPSNNTHPPSPIHQSIHQI